MPGEILRRAELRFVNGTVVLYILRGGDFLHTHEGITLISAKYEIDNGTFQVSVYTMRGDRFSEVIVDYSVGTIMKVDVITDSGDLAAAQSQKETMARAKRTLEAATRRGGKNKSRVPNGQRDAWPARRPSHRGGHPGQRYCLEGGVRRP